VGANVGGVGGVTTIQPTVQNTVTPLIIPGFFSATSTQSPIPLDHFSFSYGYDGKSSKAPGYNLSTFNLGVEKTVVDGIASIYVTVPFLQASSNITGQPISGIGDVNIGFKVAVLHDEESKSTAAIGFTAAVPSAHAGVVSATSIA